MVVFPGLKQGIFQIVPATWEHTILHLFWPNSFPSNLQKHQNFFKKPVFLDKFQTVPSFFTLSLFLFWGYVSNFIMPPPIRSVSKLD